MSGVSTAVGLAPRATPVVGDVEQFDRWNAFVAQQADASTYHDAAWLGVVSRAFGHPTVALEATENGVVTGKTAKWSGVALYGNYALSDTWRTSLRLEYLDDADGYTTGAEQKLKEGTLTFGYMPAKNYEFRVEARHDTSDLAGSTDITQAWLQALYKF